MSAKSNEANHPTCRICRIPLSAKVLTLENMPLTDDFIKPAADERNEYLRNIDIFQCSSCGVVQNPHNFDMGTYYSDYRYSSGHSEFTNRFMRSYAAAARSAFAEINGRQPVSVVEAGSGDGVQLACFAELGFRTLLGVEPSEHLAAMACERGFPTIVALFDDEMPGKTEQRFDICISSYVLDHVPQPLAFLRTSGMLLNQGGILAVEVHDLQRIVDRAEYCLFEHEHTIYLAANDLCFLLEVSGFDIVSINPVPDTVTRANSLIVIARKKSDRTSSGLRRTSAFAAVADIGDRIAESIAALDAWTEGLGNKALVGFGAGGRGVMTLAAMTRFDRFSALFDSNCSERGFLTPKTRIPVIGPPDWGAHVDAHCLVFSYGYFDEICGQLCAIGFQRDLIFSLRDFFPQPRSGRRT